MRKVQSFGLYQYSRRSIAYFDCHPGLNTPFYSTRDRPRGIGKQLVETQRQSSRLENGTRVVTEERQGAFSGIGVYVQAGARYDPIQLPGLNHVMRWSFLTSNLDSSMFQIDREFRAVGASYEHHELCKELLGFKMECRRDLYSVPLQKMFSCVSIPRFMETEVVRYRDAMDAITEELRWKTPRQWCIEEVLQLAFYREPLGMPRYVPPHINDDIGKEALLQQWRKCFHPNRITLTGINVSHQELIATFQNHEFALSSSAPHFREFKNGYQVGPSCFQGGKDHELHEKRQKVMTSMPYMENEVIGVLAWRTYGMQSLRNYAIACVTVQLLSIELQETIENASESTVEGLRSFHSPFLEVGVWGFTYRSRSEDARLMVEQGIKFMRGLKPTEEGLGTAKHRAVCRLFHDHFECARDYMDSLALSTLTDSSKFTDVLEQVDQVTAGDIKGCLEFALDEKPCMYSTGEVLLIPSLRQLGFK